MVFDILFLPLLFFISFVISYEDVKYGKVRNKWILLGIFWGLAVLFFFLIWYFIATPITHFYYFDILKLPPGSAAPVFTVSLNYLGKVILNVAIALAIAFLMWRFKAWAAGDAKLFVVYALLVPLKYYWKSYLPYFPSFVLLINIFIPVVLYLLVRSCFYYLKYIYLKIAKPPAVKKERQKKPSPEKKTIWQALKSRGKPMIGMIGIFLMLSLIQKPIRQYISIDFTSFYVIIFAALIIFRKIFKIFEKPLVFRIMVVILIVLLSYGFIRFPEATGQTLYQTIKRMIIFMIVLSLFRKLIDFYVLKTGVEEIKIENLKPKMSLAEETLEKLKKDKEYYDKYIGVIYPGGLTVEQAEAVKKWAQEKQKDKIKAVSIYKPFPFVVWMFVGLIITLLLQGSLLHLFLGPK